MHFISETRYNAATGQEQSYYRIKESFRDAMGKVRSRIMLNVGFMERPLDPYDVAAIGRALSRRFENRGQQQTLLGKDTDGLKPVVAEHVEKYWQQMVEIGSIDRVCQAVKDSEQKARRMMDTSTMKHTDAREVGAEWLALQAVRQLDIEGCLLRNGFSEGQAKDALACLITRAVYSVSELKSMDIMEDNSAVCELVYGNADCRPSFRSVYETPDRLLRIKAQLEQHLCHKTDTLFNQANRILLFDLTNFYFEGRKEGSRKARFGRSKEKRSDCKLLVLALCINTAGFIRYSSILEGNTADPASLPAMIESVIASSPVSDNPADRALVVIDAGIATEENLELIRARGFNYMCVSRRRLTDVELSADAQSVIVHDTKKRKIRLTQVEHTDGGDYFLQVNSPAKALTESSINRQWRERFEAELQRASDGLVKKGGTKNYEKVVERVGRAMAHYPSVAKHYLVSYTRSKTDPAKMGSIRWELKPKSEPEADSGIYYLRTNRPDLDERTCWDYYNLIRDIECTNRQLKTDLSLRPVYHKTDTRADAHLFLGLLAYWVVNTIRYQLKEQGLSNYWTEIVRRMSTQKLVTTEGLNPLGEKIRIRQCSEPTAEAAEIYRMLGYKDRPFTRRRIIEPPSEKPAHIPPGKPTHIPPEKICSTQGEISKTASSTPQSLTPS